MKFTLSVIIGIRDWEIGRLRVAVKSHLSCTMVKDVEVVISDYGSENHAEVAKLAAELGCTYVYTDDALWSRSRALNAGIVASSGEFILATDADIVFAPETHAITVDYLRKYPNSLQLKQCRDLPENVGLDDLEETDWAYLDSIARTRPRWGMGGLAACRRDVADRVRGYDERMVVWGAEDNDFGKRLRASGAILNWITDNSAQIYHVWHPPFMQTHPDAAEIFERNRRYRDEDPSIVRNLNQGAVYRGFEPIVSVVIATKNRASYLRASIQSVLDQSFGDFELIVIDDGSEDNTQDVLKSFKDPRLKHMHNEISLGVGGARNRANAVARGRYIAVHDDDDLMMPCRLEQQLGTIEAGVQGVYGGWIDFGNDDSNFTFVPGKQPFGLGAIGFSSSVFLHPTLMAEKILFKRLPYHDSFLAGSDYNVAFRMAWNGVQLNHCGAYVTMRRIHTANMTSVSTATQKASSLVTTSVFLNGVPGRLEKYARDEAKVVNEVKIDLTHEDIVAIIHLWPQAPYVEVVELEPSPIEQYTGNEELVLSGQIIDGKVKLKSDFRSGLNMPLPPQESAEVDAEEPEAAEVITVFDLQGLSFVHEEDDIDVLEAYGKVAGCIFSEKDAWTLLSINKGGKLADIIEKMQHVLPPKEDVVFIFLNGNWMVAFENQPDLRRNILARKLNVSNMDFRLQNIRVVRQ
jgi:glycosyltransferase involved in cell wall biosynthesis